MSQNDRGKRPDRNPVGLAQWVDDTGSYSRIPVFESGREHRGSSRTRPVCSGDVRTINDTIARSRQYS